MGEVDAACLRSFAQTLLSRAERRPIATADIDQALAAVESLNGLERVEGLVFRTLMNPDFLYRFENRGQAQGERLALTPHELASRLSFHFWGAPPDDALLAAANDGSLASEAGYEQQVDRLLDDPRAVATRAEFFGEWLHLERGGFAESPRLGVLADSIDTTGLAEEMSQEVHDLIELHLERGDGWSEILRSPLSTAKSERLAAIYDVPVWDGESEPAELPADERSGLLTRAGMLYTPDGSTNPFRRGAFLRRTILCDTVLPPPTDLPPDALTPPPTAPDTTTREAFAAKVVDEPCASCHAGFSALGYAFESYDGLGRFRMDEHLVTVDGEDHGFAAVDTTTMPNVDDSDRAPADGVLEVNERIAASPKATRCLSQQYVAFTLRRAPEGDDGCVAASIARQLDDGMSLRDALRAIAFEPSFRSRILED